MSKKIVKRDEPAPHIADSYERTSGVRDRLIAEGAKLTVPLKSLCEDRGRDMNDNVHTAYCPEGLALDYQDGNIKPRDNSYHDARETYEERYGRK